jgi:DNA mismatch endonuclease (patch repair protein)
MANIRSRHTKPEIMVRSALHRLGYRFRLHDKRLPGRPDVVLQKHKKIVLIHGCFWHQHPGCRRCTMPASNQEYWESKLQKNIDRDILHQQALAKLGWKVLIIWECETKNIEKVRQRLVRFLKK